MSALRAPRSARLAACSAIALAATGVLVATPASAQEIIDRDVVFDGITHDYRELVSLGHHGRGRITARNGGVVTTPVSRVGATSSAVGEILIDGAGSRWVNAGYIHFGLSGSGSLVISNGGEVGSDSILMGTNASGRGAIVVTGPGSLLRLNTDLSIGRNGSAVVTVADGAVLRANWIELGTLGSGRGTLNIGAAGEEPAVAAGAVIAPAVFFGPGNGSIVFNHTDEDYEFNADIVGDGTLRVMAGRTILSGDNTYTGSTLLEGGTLTLASNTALGGSTLRTTGSVVDYADGVDIANPVVIDSNTTQFQVLTGSATQSGAITEANGARPFLKVGAGELILTGDNTWSRETTVREGALTFDGGSLTNSSLLYVEQANVIVRGGGTLRSSYGYVGRVVAGAGALTVSGAGSRWINTDTIELGFASGGTLTISDGGQVESLFLYAGNNSAQGIVDVSGENSRLTVDQFYVGNSGEGFVTISGGGQVFAERTFLNATTAKGTATVTGEGSLLASADRLFIGSLREGVLTLTDGGVARVGDGAGIANLASGALATGTLNIGAASGEGPVRAGVLEAAELAFGNGAGTLNFNHTDEGYVFAPRLRGAGTVLHHAGETILTGDNSAFSGDYNVHGGRLVLEGANGQAVDPMTPGSGSTLSAEGEDAPEILIRNGGTFSGRVASASGVGEGMGLIRIAGALSSVEVEEAYAGTMGSGRIDLTDGARLTADEAWLGYFAEGALSVRDGASAEFGVLTAGLYGQSTIEITGGGRVDADFLEGAQASAASTDVTVSGEGSMLNVDNSLVLAREGRGRLQVLDGGVVTADRLSMGGGEESVGNVTVAGAGSQLIALSELGIGVENGGQGVLTIEDGGVVQAGGIGVGYGVDTTGAVVVRGLESRLAVMEAAIGYGGDGSLLLTEGGALNVGEGSGALYLGLESGSTGVLAIGALEGEEAAQAGYLSADRVVFGAGTGSLVFNHNDVSYIFQTGMSGVGDVRHLAGETWLVGDNTGFAGQTTVEGGELSVLTNLGGDVRVSGGRLRGSGSILGDVFVTTGVLQGETGQTLTMASLVLGADARTDVTLRGPGDAEDPEQPLFNVTGDLTLDGVLNVTDGDDFGAGVYRLFNYGGVLTDNGMTIDMAPTGYASDNLAIQTALAGQVNLAVSLNQLRFWDGSPDNAGNGAIDGGDGVWSLSGGNWTDVDGLGNGPNRPAPSLAVFSGSAGVVTVDNGDGAVSATGLQFASDGYVLTGDALKLVEMDGDEPAIRVGDGTAAGADMSARLDLDLTTLGALAKTDRGSLILAGDNMLDGLRVRHGRLTLTQGTTRSGGLEAGAQAGDDGHLLIVDAARLDSADAVLGLRAGARGVATVSGSGSAWTVDGALGVGAEGEGRLTVADGGRVRAQDAGVGSGDGSDGQVVVSGQGARIDITRDLVIGDATGSSGYVVLDDGGLLAAGGLVLAASEGARGGLAIGAAAGMNAASAGLLQAGEVRFGAGLGELVFNHTETDYGFTAALSGAGALRHLAGVTRLAGDSGAFAGSTSVTGGALLVDGVLGGDVSVSGGLLGGSGSVTGAVTIAGGGALSGRQGQTLRLGALTLSEGSMVSAALGAANGAAALFEVQGDLTLDGTLEVTDVGGFGAGIYRLFDYGGDLVDRGLEIASAPSGIDPGDLFIQTSVADQVNLVSTTDVELNFWDGSGAADDGAISGGSGTWGLTGRSWTGADGALNGAYSAPAFAVFAGAAGTVTVDGAGDAGIGVTGMQFAVDGYEITAGRISLGEADTVIRVGDGTAAGADMTAIIASSLTGPGGLVKTDLGTLVLTGSNRYEGGVKVRGGVLIGDAASLVGDIDNSAVLVFDQGSDADFTGALAGDGLTIKRGEGVLRVLGGSAVDWSVETGGLAGEAGRFSGDVSIASGASFTLGAEGDAVFSGVLSGQGTFAKTGAGNLSLTGNSAAFDGITEIREGRLLINGALGGELRLFDGGMVGGSGALAQLTAGDKAVIAPGNSIGVLTITGDVVFETGAVYEVEVDPASGASDRIVAGGAAILNGGVVRHVGLGGDYRPKSTYTILTAAGGVTGTFDAIETDFAFLDAALDYEANAVLMLLERNDVPFPAVGQTVNQRIVGAAVEAAGRRSPLYDAVVGQSAGNARLAFDMLAGELHGSIRSAQSEAAEVLAGVLRDRMQDTRHPDAAGPASGAAFWAEATGTRIRLATDGNAASLTQEATGLMMGADAGLGALRLGVAGGASTYAYDSHARAARADSDSFSLAAYGSGQWDRLGLKGAVSGTWHQVETGRVAAFPGFAETLTADYDAATVHAFVEASWRVTGPATTVEPFVNLARVRTRTDAFAETGGDAALGVQGRVQAASLATVGIAAGRTFDQGDGRSASLSGRVGWRHAWGDTTGDGRHAFTGGPAPAGAFTVRGLPVADDALVAELGLDIDLKSRLALAVDWSGQYGSGLNANAMSATLNWRF